MVNITVDTSELDAFFALCSNADADLKKEFELWLQALGTDFLRIIKEEIISKNVKITTNLLASFQKGDKSNVWVLSDDNLTLEVGTNVYYAKWVNDGHWQQHRFVPGYFERRNDGKSVFIYVPGSKTGMMLSAKFVEGKKYWQSAIEVMNKVIPESLESRITQWFDKYLG